MRAVLTLLLAALLLVGGLPATAAPASYPGRDPLGANDWSCRPSAERPYPAVVVHGTFGDRSTLLDLLSASLVSDGYCVFALDYGERATGHIERSAEELAGFVDEVLAATGAAKVSIVGHSQGGMMPRYFIKNLGGDGLVEDLVGLAPSNHGTVVSDDLGTGAPGPCVSCDQQHVGSDFLQQLNEPDETPGDVDYTQVVTRYDEVVVPYTSGFLEGERSTNITLQDHCRLNAAEHLTIPMDRQAITWVLEALDRDGPADPDARIGCV